MRLFRLLMRLLPREFRSDYGGEMELLFRERRRDAEGRGGIGPVIKLWRETLADMLRAAPREHVEILRQDLSYAFRLIRRNPGFTLITVLILALGIGGNTAIFSLVNAVMLRPLPFREDGRMARLYVAPEGGPQRISPRPAVFLEVEERGRFFESIVAQRFGEFTMLTQEGPERVSGMHVTSGWRETLGIEPALGRGFLPEEAAAGGGSDAVVISHGFWMRRFGGADGALGRPVTLNGRVREIVGVMPRGFNYPYGIDIWVPANLRTDPPISRGLNIQSRLKPGVDIEEVRAQLSVIREGIREDRPEILGGMDLVAVPTREVLLEDSPGLILAVLGAVAFLLLIACANVASLLLARSVSRRGEMAIRTALGASRARRLRQLLTESLLISAIGGAAGIGLAAALRPFLESMFPERIADLLPGIPLDGSVLAFALALSLATGILFGLTPALRGTRRDLRSVLERQGRSGGGASGYRTLNGLVVAEVALVCVLLVGAGLMLRDFRRLSTADLGYRAEGLMTLNVALEAERYPEGARRRAFMEGVVERLNAVPGIESAGATTTFPMPTGNVMASVEIQGRPVDPERRNLVNHRLVSPGFLETLGVPLLKGRRLGEEDGPSSQPVAVISESVARRHWPGEDPVGRQLRSIRGGAASDWVTVVGVVGDVREFYDTPETWYLPYAQHADFIYARQLTMAVRTTGLSPAPAGALRQAVWEVDPEIPVFEMATVESLYGDAIADQRLGTILIGSFALFGVTIACIGIYGVTSYAVGRRLHEIGVRMALGARPGQILGWVLGQGWRLATLGLVIGLALSLALGRSMRSVLAEVEPSDPLTFLVVALSLAGVVLLACYLPARRATRVDPSTALRHE